MRRYIYHSTHPRFPGSIDEQKEQFPGASWLSTPTRVAQGSGKFAGSGGRLIGIARNGDQIQEHLGVLVLVSMSAETFDPDDLKMDMARVARAKVLRARRMEDRKITDLSRRMTGEHAE